MYPFIRLSTHPWISLSMRFHDQSVCLAMSCPHGVHRNTPYPFLHSQHLVLLGRVQKNCQVCLMSIVCGTMNESEQWVVLRGEESLSCVSLKRVKSVIPPSPPEGSALDKGASPRTKDDFLVHMYLVQHKLAAFSIKTCAEIKNWCEG